MSVYAFKINSDTNIIESVFVVNKNAVLGPAGIPTTEVVVKYCIDLFGPGYYHWNDPTLKGSPSANRIYDSTHNAVYDVKPFPSWVLNTNTFEWEPEKINGTPNMYIENVNGIQYAAFQWLEDRKRWQARVPMRDGANGPLFIWNPLTNSYEDKI